MKKHTCSECKAGGTCYYRGLGRYVFVCANGHEEESGIVCTCPFCGIYGVENHSTTLPKKKSILDQLSLRVDARPGETEGQYQKRVAPLAKANRKAERASLCAFKRGLKSIR